MNRDQVPAESPRELTAWDAWLEVLVAEVLDLEAEGDPTASISTNALEALATILAARGWPPGWTTPLE